MNKHTNTHLFRGAFCLVIVSTLACVSPLTVHAKNPAGRAGIFANVNVSLALASPEGIPGELVTNGGFETGDFSGWTQTGDTTNNGVDMSSAHSGTYGAFFGAVGSTSFLIQNLPTTSGNAYDLTFWLANDGGTPNHFEVSWNGTMLDSITNGPAMPYTQFFYPGLVAPTGSTPLQFGFRHDPAYWRLDDVSVQLHVVKPQPDFNQDANPDLVLFNSSNHRTAFWFLHNNMLFRTQFGPTIPGGWNVIDVADFDGDGNVDYALFNATTQRTAIWYFSGSTLSRTAYGPTLPGGWALVAVGDFNGDAKPDLVLFQAATQKTAVWFLNNTTFTGSAFGPTLPMGWNIVGVGDFNRDGWADFALFSASTQQTAIWYLNETIFVDSAAGPTIAAGYELSGVADFNGNGSPDFLLFNPTTRKTAIWYLVNHSFIASAVGPTITGGWTIVAP